MLDLIRDPKKAKAASDAIKEGEISSTVGYLSERRMRKLVKQLAYDSGIFGNTAKKLEAQGLNAEKILLEALCDPQFLALESVSNHAFDSPPSETILDLLRTCGSTQCLDTLRYLMNNSKLKNDSIATFAQICDPEQLNELRPYLDSANRSPLNEICISFQNRFYERAGDDLARSRVIDFLKDYLYNAERKLNLDVIEAIAEIDQEAAASILLNPDLLFSGPPNRHWVLRQIARSNITLSQEQANRLLSQKLSEKESACVLCASATTLPEAHWDSELLRLLNLLPSISERSDRSSITDSLVDAVAIKLGYTSSFNLFNFKCDADEATPIQLRLCDLDAFQREVNNGGLLQFFFNNTGTYWKQILAATREMNHPQTTAIIEKAVKAIGLTENDTTRQSIHQKLEKLSVPQEQSLNQLTKIFYEISADLNTQIIRYVLQNREELAALSQTE